MLLSECVGNRDVIKTGLNGDLFKSETEAIIKILSYYNNREMLNIMGNFSHQICKDKFDAKANFSSYRTFYSNSKTINHSIPISS